MNICIYTCMYACVCVLFTRKELLVCFRYVLDMFYLHEYYVIYMFYICISIHICVDNLFDFA